MVDVSVRGSIGVVEWIRNDEYGVVRDLILNEKVFIHWKKNPNVHKLDEGVICLYAIQPSRKQSGWEASDAVPLHEANMKHVGRIVQEHLPALLREFTFPRILELLLEEDRERIIGKILYDIDRIDTREKYTAGLKAIELIKYLGEPAKRSFKHKLADLASAPFRFRFWVDGHLDAIDIPTLKETFFLSSKQDRDKTATSLPRSTLLALFLSILESGGRISDLPIDGQCAEMLDRAKAWPAEEFSRLADEVWLRSTESVQLQLWLRGYSERFDLAAFGLQFLLLSPEEQFLFIRRLVKDHEAKKITITVDTLRSLVRFEHDANDESSIDCSVDIALQAIADLSDGKPLSVDQQIGPVLAKHFDRKAFAKYRIKELFDRCEGRGFVSAHNKDGQTQPRLLSYQRSDQVPAGVVYCEGRKAPYVDRTHGVEFWFCRHTPCFMPCNQGRAAPQWEKYTLRDMLRVLRIPFDEAQYQTFLGYLNRVNDLLAHLNCRSCAKILTPLKESNFAFYRATRFKCTNAACTNNEEVYLNHCLHPRCGKVVDSRDAAKCSNSWHVCPNCFSCCSTAKFSARMERLGSSTPESLRKQVLEAEGHMEKGIHFCFKCSSELIGSNEKYRQTLKWLVANSKTDRRIWKSDRRKKDGGMWFVVDFPMEKYTSLISMGFEVRPMESGNARLLSEPLGGNEFTLGRCPNESCERHGKNCQPNFSYRVS